MATTIAADPVLHKDPITGEMISKSSVFTSTLCLCLSLTIYYFAYSELKRRIERREKEAKKAQKAADAAASQSASATKPAAAAEEELTPNVYAPHIPPNLL